MPIDFKKEQRVYYQPQTTPSAVDLPEMLFIMADGQGNPNTSAAYQQAVEMLYGISYAVKMRKKGGQEPPGYYDYVVPPLEGLWHTAGGEFDPGVTDKAALCWTAMLRVPEYVTPDVFESAKQALAKKKPTLPLSVVRLEAFREGLCAQVMHIGPYDDEPLTVAALKKYVADTGHRIDLSEKRRHHELYLGDPRKTAPEKLKTIIRYPISK
ncbi:hypothetical protein FACS1894196_4670 [Clostridia bacterium]|nr:hypothetical protein FACS1894196_4670 [Clostridia bacterium]